MAKGTLNVGGGNIAVDSAGRMIIDGGQTMTGTLKMVEQADASADTAAQGQIWVNTATPNQLYFTDYTAIDDDTLPIQVATSDTVAFLFIQNTDASNLVYLNWNGAAAAAAGNLYVGAGETWYGRLTLTLVGSIHAITSTSTVNCVVAALIDDVSA